jgi:lysozyme
MAHDLKSMLTFEEGRKYRAYPDPLTHGEPWTIGIGYTGPDVGPDTVWTDERIDDAYNKDATRAMAGCVLQLAPWFGQLDPSGTFNPANARQCVLVGMAFQMGIDGLLEFQHMLASARDGHWDDAAAAMLDSKWARQTPGRASRMSRQLASGDWQ